MPMLPIIPLDVTEGTFTPSLKNCTATFTERSGVYCVIADKLVYVAAHFRGTMSAVNGNAIVDCSAIPSSIKKTYQSSNAFSAGIIKAFSQLPAYGPLFVTPSTGEMAFRNASGTSNANWTTSAGSSIVIDVVGMWLID